MTAAQAAKEPITAPVFSLAASAALPAASWNYETNPTPLPAPATCLRFAKNDITENSHRDHQLPTVVLYPGIDSVNSNTASGLRVSLYDSGRRSRSTGKERDTETNNDFFQARYMSAPQGRFTSSDPLGNLVADPTNTQSWNLYSYVWNSPLALIDPSGLDPLNLSSVSDIYTVGNCSYVDVTYGEGDSAITQTMDVGYLRPHQPTERLFHVSIAHTHLLRDGDWQSAK